MHDVIIRPLTEADVAAVHEIESLCFPMPWSEASIRHDITENVAARWRALCEDGRLVAYAGMWLIIDEAHVTNVAVHPSFRRKGYGEAIVRALMQLAQDTCMGLITLEVRRSNAGAQALYHKVGFLDVGYRKRYYEDNKEDALIMYCQFAGQPGDGAEE